LTSGRRIAVRHGIVRPSGETLVVLLLLPLVAYLLALNHGLLPNRAVNLPASFTYSGFIECDSEQGLWPSATCSLIGLPTGFRPLGDVPYIGLGKAIRKLSGLEPLTAKKLTDGVFVLLSFLSLLWLQHRLGVNLLISVIVALCYLCLPFVWGHSGLLPFYIGVLLMPVYLSVDYCVFPRLISGAARLQPVRLLVVAIAYIAVRVFSIFEDPYTAVMYVAVSAVTVIWVSWRLMSLRRFAPIARIALVWLLSVGAAVALYKSYVPGGGDYVVMPVDFFRAQGVDVASLFIPSHLLWWSNALDIGVRAWNPYAYYGDGTNVSFNYLGYVCLVTALVFCLVKLSGRPVWKLDFRKCFWLSLVSAGALCLAVSLGPSIKINDARAPSTTERFGFADYLMPEESATWTLPSENLFVTLPGIKNMRAIYRWVVVPKLVLLVTFALVATRVYARRRVLGVLLAVLALSEHLPNLSAADSNTRHAYTAYRQFNDDVLAEMRRAIGTGQRVFFLSSQNDILANYLSPMLGVFTYNMGGDKSIEIISREWPSNIRRLRERAESLTDLEVPALAALVDHDVDAVVIPYFNLRWDSYDWPPDRSEREERRNAVLDALAQAQPPLRLVESDWFAVLELENDHSRDRWRTALSADPNPIVVCGGEGLGATTLTWSAEEAGEVQIRVGSPAGKLLVHGGQAGRVETGSWVTDGMVFFLQDVTGARPLTWENSVAALVVHVTDAGCSDSVNAARGMDPS
jgi:hypothetical protein